MTIQDQFNDTIRQTQEAWAGVVQALTDNVSKSFGAVGQPFAPVDPNAAIDQVYDFWTKTLELQRDVAKQVVGVSVATGEKLRSHAESFTSTPEQG